MGIGARVDVHETEDAVTVNCVADDVGLLIGSTDRRSTRCSTSSTRPSSGRARASR